MDLVKYSKKLGNTKGRAKYIMLWFIPFAISLVLIHFKATHLFAMILAFTSMAFISVRVYIVGKYDIEVFEHNLKMKYPNSYGTY